MAIDWTLNINGILTILTLGIGGVAFMVTVQKDIKDLQDAGRTVNDKLSLLAEAVTAIARADERIAGLSKRIDDDRAEGAEWRHWVRDEFSKIAVEFNQAWSAINKKAERA